MEVEGEVMKETGFGNKVISTFGYGASVPYKCMIGESQTFQFQEKEDTNPKLTKLKDSLKQGHKP